MNETARKRAPGQSEDMDLTVVEIEKLTALVERAVSRITELELMVRELIGAMPNWAGHREVARAKDMLR